MPEVVRPDPVHYFDVIGKYKKNIAILTLSTAIIAAIYSLTIPNIYTAESKILPLQQQTNMLSSAMMQGALANMPGDLFTEKTPARLYAELLKIKTLRDPIIDRYKLLDVYKRKYRQDVYAALNANISIVVGKEGIITVTVDDKDPKRAAGMANDLIDELQKMTVKFNVTGAGNNRAFLEERLAKAKSNLEASAEVLRKYQEKNKTLSFTDQAAGSIKGIAELEAQVADKEVQLALMRRTLTDSMPEVKNMKIVIASMKSQISRYEQGKGGGVVPRLGSAPELAKEFLAVMRDFKTNEVIVEQLNKQYEMSRISEANNVPTMQVLQKAIPPERKSRPKRAKIVLTTAFVALFFSVTLVLFYEYVISRKSMA
jgi:uncharacterized protein involved in exopolysaccharide biosynthesis